MPITALAPQASGVFVKSSTYDFLTSKMTSVTGTVLRENIYTN